MPTTSTPTETYLIPDLITAPIANDLLTPLPVPTVVVPCPPLYSADSVMSGAAARLGLSAEVANRVAAGFQIRLMRFDGPLAATYRADALDMNGRAFYRTPGLTNATAVAQLAVHHIAACVDGCLNHLIVSERLTVNADTAVNAVE